MALVILPIPIKISHKSDFEVKNGSILDGSDMLVEYSSVRVWRCFDTEGGSAHTISLLLSTIISGQPLLNLHDPIFNAQLLIGQVTVFEIDTIVFMVK